MSNYTKQISWSGKDALSDSDPEKVISGGDFDTEFSAVQTAINSKIDTGGVVASDIASNAITEAKIADNAITEAKIADNAITLAKMAHGTDGEIITYDSSGAPATVGVGTSGQVLTSNGAGSAPSMQDAGGGKVLQVVSTTKVDTFTTTSTSFTDVTGLTLNITPSATSSKILVLSVITFSNSGSGHASTLRLLRDGSTIGGGTAASNRPSALITTVTTDGNGARESIFNASTSFLDSPSSTSSLTYKIQILGRGATATVNRSGDDNDEAFMGRTSSTITLMEIGA